MAKVLILVFFLISSAFAQFPSFGRPSFPSAPSLPRAPALPSVPALPRAPALPSTSSLPGASSLPSAPSLPGASSLPNVGSLQSGLQSVVTPFAQIQSHLNAQRNNLASYLNLPNASNATLGSLFPGLNGIGPNQLSVCYNSTLGAGNAVFDIFQNSIFDVVTSYYKEFPENFDLSRFPEKTANLFKSMQEIATHTLACLGAPKGFQLGLTQLSDWSIGEFTKLMGAKKIDSSALSKYLNRPKNLEEEESVNEVPARRPNNPFGGFGGGGGGGLFRGKREATIPADPNCFPKDTSPIPATYDWKGQGLVTDVRYQGQCGSCWTFASIASLESAYRIKGKSADLKFDLSEQQLLTCAKDNGKGNGCDGGTPIDAFNFILSNFGVTDEKSIGYDYEKSDKTCETKKKKRHAKIKDYCLRGTYVTVDGKPEVLTDADIQSAIREFGSVYATVYGEDTSLKHYKSGVFDDPKCSKETNHAITIVGWDEKAWIVKNSWGTKWGEDGFFRMKRGENMCGINTYITFPIV